MRDNALAAELIRQGHDVVLVPLYTPTRTDEANVSSGKVFFGGVSVILEQKSALFRFADDIDVQAIPVDGGKSALAIYSRSRVGYSDLGVNRKRIERWLSQIS